MAVLCNCGQILHTVEAEYEHRNHTDPHPKKAAMTKNNDDLLFRIPNKYSKLLYSMHKGEILGSDIIIEIRNDIQAGKLQVLQELLEEVKDFRDCETGNCPDCGGYYPCWHQQLRQEGLNQVVDLIQKKLEENQ